jgi:hypothetical protein
VSAATRIGIYAVTGGFFYLTQLSFLFFCSWLGYAPLHGWLMEMSSSSKGIMSNIPQGLHSSLGTLLTALAILSVFITGLILDLLGSTSFYAEMSVLKKDLDKNHSWLDRLVENHKDYFGADYKHFMEKFSLIQTWKVELSDMPDPPTSTMWNVFFRVLVYPLLSKSRYTRTLYTAYKLIPTYDRIQSFMFSFVLAAAEAPNLDSLLEEMRVWRTVRGITVAGAFVAFEVTVVGLYWFTDVVFANRTPGMWSWLATIGAIGYWILVVLFYLYFYETRIAPRLAERSYATMSLTLFSLLYLTADKVEKATNEDRQIVAPSGVVAPSASNDTGSGNDANISNPLRRFWI